MEIDVCFNPVFESANETRCRYRVMKGSAGSGKSVNIAQDYILKLMDRAYAGANLLVVRKIGDWNRQSTYAELVSAIWRICGPYADQYWEVKQSPLSLRCRTTQNEILFRGFNPRARRGRDARLSIGRRSNESFNPRARRGRDWSDQRYRWRQIVSIHAPAGGATCLFRIRRMCFEFQSTRPQGARRFAEQMVQRYLELVVISMFRTIPTLYLL